MKKKRRLDHILLEQYPDISRALMQSLIMQGKVTINGIKNTKAGTQVSDEDEILLDFQEPKYVSRGGFKLEAALEHFHCNVENLVALDAGISTGGFTDCLLQHNIKKVYGIDVGYGQVHEKIRTDKRVNVLEKVNLRYLDKLPEPIDIVTLDLSFISILKVVEALLNVMHPQGHIIALIKPQFEAERCDIRRGGVVKDESVHERVIQKVINGMALYGFECQGIIPSPILGATSGNKEFLGHFIRKTQ